MTGLLRACEFLTVGRRFSRGGSNPAEIGRAAVYFPLVGLCFGLVLTGVNAMLEAHLESEILAGVQVTVLIVLTGAAHLEELQKTFDTFSAENLAAALPPDSIRMYGLLAVMLVVFFKIRSLEVIGDGRPFALLVLPMLARWAGVLFLYSATRSAPTVQAIAERVKAWHMLLATTLVLAITAYGLKLPGLWVALWMSVLALLARPVLQRCCGALRQQHVGAVIELSEALSFVLIASL
jgi:adenosylcobinamide-GDP ribazoletransferase